MNDAAEKAMAHMLPDHPAMATLLQVVQASKGPPEVHAHDYMSCMATCMIVCMTAGDVILHTYMHDCIANGHA